MFVAFRRIGHWLHQHIFKVGWLFTRNFRTTTILYYTFFFPGVVLYEVIVWLVAGALDVRAERAIQMPQAQEAGELHLNFVRISSRVPPVKRVVIQLSPMLVGGLFIWHVAANIFNVQAFITTISSGELDDVLLGFRTLTSVPDFWLWFYLVFTVSNTMLPTNLKELAVLRTAFIGIIVVSLVLLVVGIGANLFSTLAALASSVVYNLQILLLMLIVMNVLMTLALGLIEYTVESVTGHSATFVRGRMVTTTRQQAQEERKKQQERAAVKSAPAASQQPVSVYDLTFPIPSGPTRESVTQLTLGLDAVTADSEAKNTHAVVSTAADVPTPPLLPASPTPDLAKASTSYSSAGEDAAVSADGAGDATEDAEKGASGDGNVGDATVEADAAASDASKGSVDSED